MKVLIIVAHPDDEVLGCGGTIAKHIADGDTVGVIAMTDGVSARASSGKTDAVVRNEAFERSCENLGVSFRKLLSFPDNKMDSVALIDIVKSIESVLQEQLPELIYTHYPHDLNIDHRITHNAVLTACRPLPNYSVQEIRAFEVVSSTHWNSVSEFSPQIFIDITAHVEKKIESLKIYGEEMRPWPHQRSLKAIESLESFRGATVGVERAEAFSLIRKIIKK